MNWRNPENRDHDKEIEIASVVSGRILKGVYRHIRNSALFTFWIGEDTYILPRKEWVVIS